MYRWFGVCRSWPVIRDVNLVVRLTLRVVSENPFKKLQIGNDAAMEPSRVLVPALLLLTSLYLNAQSVAEY